MIQLLMDNTISKSSKIGYIYLKNISISTFFLKHFPSFSLFQNVNIYELGGCGKCYLALEKPGFVLSVPGDLSLSARGQYVAGGT